MSLHRQRRYPAAVVELGAGSPLPGSARNALRVPISREDAERITDTFEQEGFFRRNEMSTYILHGLPDPPYYTMDLSAGPDTTYYEHFSAGPVGTARITALSDLVHGDARTALRRLTVANE